MPSSTLHRSLTSLLLAALLACAQQPQEPAPVQPPVSIQPSEPLRELGFQRVEEGWLLDLGARSQFEFGSDALNPAAVEQLQRVARALTRLELTQFRIEGHADEIGSDAFNLALSERRAQAVARVLLSGGLAPHQLQVQGFGKRRPIADNQTEAGRALNRRVVLIVPAAR